MVENITVNYENLWTNYDLKLKVYVDKQIVIE